MKAIVHERVCVAEAGGNGGGVLLCIYIYSIAEREASGALNSNN